MSVVLALAFLLQGPAEEEFRKIEDRIAKARRLRVDYEVKVEGFAEFLGHERGLEDSCTLILKEGNRGLLTGAFNLPPSRPRPKVQLLSDGKILVVQDSVPRDAPNNVREGLASFVTRGSAHLWFMVKGLMAQLSGSDPDYDEKWFDMKKETVVTDFRMGADDGALKTLTYKFGMAGGQTENFFDVKLWYDPDGRNIAKRVLSRGPDKLVEKVTKFVVDGDVPDETFALPSGVAQVHSSLAALRRLASAVDRFKAMHGRYPRKLEQLTADGSLEKIPADGWGGAFIYRVPGTNGRAYDLGSWGADGKEGGEGPAADLWYPGS